MELKSACLSLWGHMKSRYNTVTNLTQFQGRAEEHAAQSGRGNLQSNHPPHAMTSTFGLVYARTVCARRAKYVSDANISCRVWGSGRKSILDSLI